MLNRVVIFYLHFVEYFIKFKVLNNVEPCCYFVFTFCNHGFLYLQIFYIKKTKNKDKYI